MQLLTDFSLYPVNQISGKKCLLLKENKCFYISADNQSSSREVPELNSRHREADPKLAFHAVYAASIHAAFVVADDTDVFILLLFVAAQTNQKLYFRQGTASSKGGITYHDVTTLAEHLGEDVCKVLPTFHVVTGSDFTQPFFGRSKFRCLKKMKDNPQTMSLLSSLESSEIIMNDVTDFILHVIYNRPKKEKTPGDSRYAMLFTGKGKKRKFTP